MSVDFLCILRSLLWMGGRDLERKKGLFEGSIATAPQQGCLSFLEPLLNQIWRGKEPPKLGRFSFGALRWWAWGVVI